MTRSRPLTAVAALIAVVAIAGCTMDPSSTGSAPSPHPSATSSPTGSPDDSQLGATMQAVMVVAGVDVDGKNVTVSGYVAGILEAGGECTYSFVGNTTVPSVESAGVADRNSTSCGSVQAPFDEFTRGTWKATLTYTALSGRTTVSEPLTMEIP